MEIQKHALSVVRISQFSMERGIFGGVIPEHAKACRRSIWSTFSPGISPVESMHVATRPIQTSSSQQPMDLADYLSTKIHLVVS